MNEHRQAPTRGRAPSVDRMVPVMELVGLRKSYGNTVALDGAALTLRAGEVCGLIGENGAGKSTLVRILSGLAQPDSGTITLDGVEVVLPSPARARRLGIATVFQELSLVPDLSVGENLLLASGKEPWVRGRRRRREYEQHVCAEWGLAGLSPQTRVMDLSLRDRQVLEILAAAVRRPRILVLDEPTSSLLPADVDWLEWVLRRLCKADTAVLFISHSLDEVERLCSQVTVQRNGRQVATYVMTSFDRRIAIEQMIGRSLGAAFPEKTALPKGEKVVLSVRGLTTPGARGPIDFDVHEGEIVGVAGLEGQGQRSILEALAGAVPPSSGDLTLDGREISVASPARAMGRRGGGIAFVPADRKTQGLVLDLSVLKNVALPALRWLSTAGIVNDRKETAQVTEVLDRVQVDRSRLNDPVRHLSGGNQQKVVFARATMANARVMVMYDPTRGVDVGTKFELYSLIQEMSRAGQAVVLYSSEIPELVNLCHRVLVVYGGRVVEQLEGDSISEAEIMAAAIRAETKSYAGQSGTPSTKASGSPGEHGEDR